MEFHILILLLACILSASAWSLPFYPVPRRAPMRFTRFAPPPAPSPHRIPGPKHHRLHEPIRVTEPQDDDYQRPKRNHHDHDRDDYDSNHQDHHEYGDKGVTGPVHTFVKTDKNANYKWGVRHHVGGKYAS